MKKLGSFLTEYVSSKNDVNDKENIDEGKVYTYDGKKTKIKWGVDEPIDNDVSDDIDMDSSENTDAMEDLIDKFEVEEPFFIVGQAGWGKTSTIKSLAKKYNRTVITVYLDKAEAVDLGGIPVPVSGKMNVVANAKDLATGKVKKTEFAKQLKALPPWAAEMLEHPETDYLLFFDEMNQAAPDVMNALMPIVLDNVICEIEFDNFFVGAAGNFEEENQAVSELSKPLKSRFKPLIVWEAGTEKAWKQVFRYLHKKWDNVLGKDIVDEFEDKVDVFENPRELEQKVFQFMHRMKVKGSTRNDAARFARRLQNLAKEDLTRTQQNNLKELAETMFNFLTSKNSKGEEKKPVGRSSRKDINMVDENIKAAIKQGMKFGYIEQEGVKYGISEENIDKIEEWNTEDCNGEMRQRIIDKFKNDGIEFKFKTDAEWKKKGYKDPNEE